MATPTLECVDIKLDAFVLRPGNIPTQPRVYIPPLDLPDYASFVPGRYFLNSDIVSPLDLRTAQPWSINSRVADLTTGTIRKDRMGIYLHWCIPQRFRSGQAGTRSAAEARGLSAASHNVEYPAIPDRWLIFRFIDRWGPQTMKMFVVESNRIRTVADIDPSTDIETESAPFFDPRMSAYEQAQCLLGIKFPLDGQWDPTNASGAARYHSPLPILDAGNTLFADFQPHNANVFSIRDDMTYVSGDDILNLPNNVAVSYFIMGYNSTQIFPSGPSSTTFPAPTTPICHGSLYKVVWGDCVSKAAEKANFLNTHQPVAVGNDAVDAMSTYLKSIPEVASHAAGLDALATHFSNQDMSSRLPDAPKIVSSFAPGSAGIEWSLDTQPSVDGQPTTQEKMTNGQMMALYNLNTEQSYLDALVRSQKSLKHLIFCEWWKHRAEAAGDGSVERRRSTAKEKSAELFKSLRKIADLIKVSTTQLATLLEKYKADGPFTSKASARFFSSHDPMLLVGNMGSAWPSDYTQPAASRQSDNLLSNVKTGPIADKRKKWLRSFVDQDPPAEALKSIKAFFTNATVRNLIDQTDYFDRKRRAMTFTNAWDLLNSNQGLQKLPSNLLDATYDLLQEWFYLMEQPPKKSEPDDIAPYYSTTGEDRWNGQPWLPLFLEWEIEYMHIGSGQWSLTHLDNGSVQYSVQAEPKTLEHKDLRTFGGRSILVPQAGFQTSGIVRSIFESSHPDGLNQAISKDEQDKILDSISKAEFLSCRLEGFTDHLLTLLQGTHVVANQKTEQNDLVSGGPEAALRPFLRFGSHESVFQSGSNDLELLTEPAQYPEGSGGFDVTPYGKRDVQNPGYSIFKPATHGRARFTKFNIADKFGQVISAFNARPSKIEDSPLVLSLDSLACNSATADGADAVSSPNSTRNIVKSDFFQIAPRINQDAKITAFFLAHQDHTAQFGNEWMTKSNADARMAAASAEWRATAPWEDPVWGWLVINFPNQSLQLYSPDGTFFGEAQLQSGLETQTRWRNASGETTAMEVSANNLTFLAALLKRMDSASYVKSLWEILTNALGYISEIPGEYQASPLSLIGRPFALVSVGLAIELANEPMQSQSYFDEWCKEEEIITKYQFGLRLGSKETMRDGMIGYFTPFESTQNASEIMLDMVHSEFAQAPHITGNSPAFRNPVDHEIRIAPRYTPVIDMEDSTEYAIKLAQASTIANCIVDPFLDIHISSGILPVKTLKLSQTKVTQALSRIQMFMQSGPVILNNDIPEPELYTQEIGAKPTTDKDKALPIPAGLPEGHWSWIQPVLDETNQLVNNEVFNAIQPPGDLAEGIGPITVLEGFLQAKAQKGRLS